MMEGHRVSRIRGFAVASATAVTTVGAVAGVAPGNTAQSSNDFDATAADATLLADIPAGQQAQVQGMAQQADSQAIAADAATKKSAEEAARKQAAEDAAAKKEAAEKKAEAEKKAAAEKLAKEREEAQQEAASRSTRGSSSFPVQSAYTAAEVQAIARQMVPADQFQCFSDIVERESSWNYQADNPTSDAYGLMQALPGSKMSSAGADWQTNPATQIKWGLNYMNDRYDSPCGAWQFWQANNWY
ncbi:transglycosylase SLT domain-containing protein [Streptomyces maremycinicus]|uniref:aggregation-promoting factor C-terminal-like domain-containing protein n=1 Tax=Streptomyces maremycinicus TaxID=1679753 RepID=UPI0007878332|nr:transglycosylase SLT domain-containing protein [Streptomyces sp. NBRC 110468]